MKRPLLAISLAAPFAAVCLFSFDRSRAELPTAHRVDDLSLGDGMRFVRREMRANTTCSSAQSAVSIDLSDAGEIAVAWDSRRQQDGYYGVVLQRFDRAGRRVGEETAGFAEPGHHQRTPTLTYGRDGSLWVGWESVGPDGIACRLRQLAADGAPIDLGDGVQSGAAIATLRDGSHVAVWVGTDPLGDEHAYRRRLSADGRPLEPARRVVSAPRTEASNLPQVAALADGGYALAWAARRGRGEPDGLRVQTFDADGTPRSVVRSVCGERAAGSIEPSLAARPGGGFVVAWMDNGGERRHYDVVAQLFDGTATPEGEAIIVAPARGPQSGATVAVARDGTGRVVVAWNAADGDDVPEDVRARLLDASGQPICDAFVVHGRTEGQQAMLAANNKRTVAFGPDGQLAFGWAGDGGLGDETGAHLTLLVPAGAPLAALASDPRPEEPRSAPLAARAPDLGATIAHEVADPHDPPIYNGPVDALVNGGDRDPAPTNDGGFIAITNTGWTPPDPHLAAGPNHVVAIVNGGIAFFDKTGRQTFLQTISGGAGFWGSVGATSFVFDPRAIFDPHAGRFIAMAVERTNRNGSGRSLFLVAVSDDDDPNGTWYKYRFDVTQEGGSGGIDFPHLGVDDRAVYLTANVFNGGGPHLIYVLDKAPLLTGQPTTTTFLRQSTATSACVGVIYDAARPPLMIRQSGSSTITLIAVRSPRVNPSLQTFNLSVPQFGPPARAPQRGTSRTLWTVDNRFWQCVVRGNRMWAVHHQGTPCRARWYEIDVTNWPGSGRPTIVQSGEINLGADVSTFFPSIGVDPYGNALVAFSRSSPSEFVSISRAYRNSSDALNTLPNVAIVKTSSVPYTNSAERWGDYSAVSLDPNDNTTFWFHNEYAATSSSWNTWISYRRVQGPTLTADQTTLSSTTGGAVNFTLDNPSHPNQRYYLLATASGQTPAFRLPSPPGYVFLNLNFDALTEAGVVNANTPTFGNFIGTLDAAGQATATFRLPPLPGVQGITLDFAYAQDGRVWDFASDVASVGITL